MSTLIVVATYNEVENLPRLVEEIFEHAPDADLLVIDDASPDGTGQWCDERAKTEKRFTCLHRSGKLGLGTATIAGMRQAIERGYDAVVTMDADFSHSPVVIPKLRAGLADPDIDVVIGSRYVAGGAVEGWPLFRRIMSRGVNWYARLMLGLPVKDCSGAFRCYRAAALKKMDLAAIRSRGYAYLEEILWRLQASGARFAETPITFVDRKWGKSKIDMREAFAALAIMFKLGLVHRFSAARGRNDISRPIKKSR